MLNQGVVVSKFGPWGKNGVCCCALEPNVPFGLNGLNEKYKKSIYIFLAIILSTNPYDESFCGIVLKQIHISWVFLML